MHLVRDCPGLWKERREIFLDGEPGNNPDSWSVQDLLDYSHLPKVAGALERTYLYDEDSSREASDTSQ